MLKVIEKMLKQLAMHKSIAATKTKEGIGNEIINSSRLKGLAGIFNHK